MQITPATINHGKLAIIPVIVAAAPTATTLKPKIFLDFNEVIFWNVEVAT